MKRSLLLVAAARMALSSPVPEEMVDVNMKAPPPPSGIGTGVTIAIAPPGGIPKGCYNVWNGAPFGIAAVPVQGSGRLVDLGFNEEASATADIPKFSLDPAALSAKNKFVDLDGPAPTEAPALRLVDGVAKAPTGPSDAEPDVTITRKITRTQTRTVTLASENGASPVRATPTAVDLTGLRTIKAAQLYQIADGQIQADTKLTPIPLKPVPKPSAASPTAFAPLSSGAPRISQIFDGQIQAPTAAALPKAAKSNAPAVEAGSAKASPKPAAAAQPAAKPAPVAPAAAPPAVAVPAAGMTGGDMGGHGGHMKRQSGGARMGGYGCRNKDNSTLEMTLKNGVLKDKREWIGYIADNRQFQFDNPPQSGAQVTAGFSVCDDGFLALGPSKVFYRCLSGSFYNLYDKSIGGQCSLVNLILLEQRDC